METLILKNFRISISQYLFFILKNIFFVFLINGILFFVLNNVRNQSNRYIAFYEISLVLYSVFFIFLIIQKQRLTSLSTVKENTKIYLKINYYHFLILKKSIITEISDLSYSYEFEKSSKLGLNKVLRIFDKKNLIITRQNLFGGFDGFNDEQILNLVHYFDELGIKELKKMEEL